MRTALLIISIFVALAIGVTCYMRGGGNPLQAEGVIMYENKSAKFIREYTRMPIGDDCKIVNYYMRGGGLQDLTMVSKFSCPKEKADSIVKSLIEWNDRQIGSVGDRFTLMAAPYNLDILPQGELAKIIWWDLRTAKVSKASISKEGFGCSFWITEPVEDQVTIYIYQKS